MSFDFSKFMTAMSTMLPAIGQTVNSLHPDNEQEHIKINTGVALVQAFTQALSQLMQPPANGGQ